MMGNQRALLAPEWSRAGRPATRSSGDYENALNKAVGAAIVAAICLPAATTPIGTPTWAAWQ